jgi:hypothetical protein
MLFGSSLSAYAAFQRRRLYLKRLKERRRLAQEREKKLAQKKKLPAPVKASPRTLIPARTASRKTKTFLPKHHGRFFQT